MFNIPTLTMDRGDPSLCRPCTSLTGQLLPGPTRSAEEWRIETVARLPSNSILQQQFCRGSRPVVEKLFPRVSRHAVWVG